MQKTKEFVWTRRTMLNATAQMAFMEIHVKVVSNFITQDRSISSLGSVQGHPSHTLKAKLVFIFYPL